MIFIDSSFFIALILENDQWHGKALKLIPKLEKSQKMVSGLIISEAVTIVGSRAGGKAGKMIYDTIKDNCKIVDSDLSHYDSAIYTFLKYDGTLSLTDSVSVEIMKTFNISKIVSFDSDFDKVNGINRIY
ncbi:MAG: PIN domain-containing protein [Methanobacteriaceae archaeon]|nr:PIN domain-containing protein [Methanobacteriaceae archaeon]